MSGREPTVDHELRIERVDERAGAAAERSRDGVHGRRLLRPACGGRPRTRAANSRGISGRAPAERTRERPPVDLEIPAPRGPAGAAELRSPNGRCPNSPPSPSRTGDRPPVHDEHAADADLDREVENGAASRAAPRRASARPASVASLPAANGRPRSERGTRAPSSTSRHPNVAACMSSVPETVPEMETATARDPGTEGGAVLVAARRISASAVPATPVRAALRHPHDPPAELDDRDTPAAMGDLGRAHDWPARMRDEEPRRAAASEHPGRRLFGQKAAGPQPRGDLGHRAAAQAQDLGGIRPRDPGPLVDEPEDGERSRRALIRARPGVEEAAHDAANILVWRGK